MALSKRQRRSLRKNGILDSNEHVPQRGMKLQPILPKTFAQQMTFDAFDSGDHLLLHGMAGTGQTFVSFYLALSELFNNPHCDYYDIQIIRRAVPTRDNGFLPGK